MKSLALSLILLSAPLGGCATAPAQIAAPVAAASEYEARARVAAFLDAFNRMDLAAFDTFWHPRATTYLPFELPQHGTGILTGREAVLAGFHMFLEAQRERRGPGGTLGLSPHSLDMEMFGDTAIATFALGRSARRTLVLAREGDEWLVTHMHASNLAPAEREAD